MDSRYRLTALALCCWLCPVIAVGYPITPEPLWSLTSEADLILLAEVTEIDALSGEEDDWGTALARLKVLETWKGARLARVEVAYPAGLVCPAPPQYLQGEKVVAFLSRYEKQWHTVALSYGTLYPQGPELEDLRTMVGRAVSIQRSTSTAQVKERRRLEWLVQAAALPGTRWHGLYELAPSSDRIRSYYDRSERPGSYLLAPRHQRLLAEALVRTPRMDPTLAMMLRVLGDHEDSRVDQVALGALEGLLALEDPPWWATDLMWAVLARFGDRKLEARLEKFSDDCSSATSDQLRALWSEAKSELAIPEVPPTEIETERYLPVGGRTPS
jgi:hypothetical protein